MPRGGRRGAGQYRTSSRCIFCDAEPPLTDEHIFGDWLRELGYTGEGVREIVSGDGSEPIIQRGGFFSKKLKIVCADCNGRWMSSLEEAAKPLLIRIFNLPYSPYQQPHIGLDTNDQLALARWAFKTAVVASYITRQEIFPAKHREEFHAHERHDPPQRAQIWTAAATVPIHPVHGESLGGTEFRPRELAIRQGGSTVVQTAYEAQVRLFNVVFVVMGYVDDGSTDVMARIELSPDLSQVLTPIWPPTQGGIEWPPPRNIDAIGGMNEFAKIPVFGSST